MISCLRSFCLVESRASTHKVPLGLDSMMLHYVTVKSVISTDLVAMLATDGSGETRRALHVGHHEIESIKAITVIIIIVMRRPGMA